MSHYKRFYAELTREQADEQAIEDIREYLSDKQWATLMMMVEEEYPIHQFNMGFAIAGVQGYPVHAFLRKYRLEAFRAWMHEGDDAVLTDEQGFPLPD